MKILIFLILTFSFLSVVTNNEIATDLDNFNSDTYVANRYQIICYLYHNLTNNKYYFASISLEDKCHAIAVYKSIVTDWNSITRNAIPIVDSILNVDNNTNYDSNQILCVLRNDDRSMTPKTVPDYSTLSTLHSAPDFRYANMPSIFGYHSRGGSFIVNHDFHKTKTISTTCGQGGNDSVSYDLIKFNILYNQYYNDISVSYDNTVNSALWGPYYRYKPAPENMFNFSNSFPYYKFPAIYFGNNALYLASNANIETIDLSGETFASALNTFFNDSQDTSKTILPSCGSFSSGKYYIARGYGGCTYNVGSSGKVSCVSQTSGENNSNTITGLTGDTNPICRDSNGGRWLVLVN